MPRLEISAISQIAAADVGAAALGPLTWRALGDAGGLTQYGVSLETLGPGGRTSDRHWHEAEDEFVYVLDGALTLVEDTGEVCLGLGEAAAFPAGNPVGHSLENRSNVPARFLIVGTRAPRDVVHYTTSDKIEIREGSRRIHTHRDGSPYQEKEGI